jgi:hypothetical protein
VLDESGSMSTLRNQVISVFNKQIQHLITRSKELSQETRTSVFTFSDTVKNIVFDVDVLRTPDISTLYNPKGNTALIDGTLQAISDLKKIPQIYGDFGMLIYILSDGMNNIHNNRADELAKTINSLPENYTVAFLAPDSNAVYEAKRFGFPSANIQKWDTTIKGTEEMGESIRRATDNYMVARSTGLRSTKSLFNLDASNLSKTVVKQTLTELRSNEYELIPVRQDRVAIKEYIENYLGHYQIGSAYYELNKKETIQANKQLAVQDKINGQIYVGVNARNLLNLPDYEVKVNPVTYGKFRIFVQSNSVNRCLIKGTQVLVLK